MGTKTIAQRIAHLREHRRQLPNAPERATHALALMASLWQTRLNTGWTPPSWSTFPWAMVRRSLAALVVGGRWSVVGEAGAGIGDRGSGVRDPGSGGEESEDIVPSLHTPYSTRHILSRPRFSLWCSPETPPSWHGLQ